MEATFAGGARFCIDPERAKDGINGSASLNTVRAHARATETMRRLVTRVHGAPWPKTVAHFIYYVDARAAEPCGPSVPNQTLRAVTWTERAAGLNFCVEISARPKVQRVVANTEMLLGASKGPTMMAARFTSAFIGALAQLCYMRDPARVETGFTPWRESHETAEFERDYISPRCDDASQAVVRKPARHAEAATTGQDVPRRVLAFIPEEVAGFWTEHPARATLSSASSAMGISKGDRDYLGRRSPKGADTYSARGAMRSGMAFVELDEDASILDLANWLVARKSVIERGRRAGD
ncbi:unnamed protein product [Prorocentrum cordatum]|uniref:Uncharacterized protein n=1 Tax=Prorocentrum cordatum TaxID=2364126 RepID=A0ABN9XZ14_9DINO|nr:unnamed protein product [Polarella glacialis]